MIIISCEILSRYINSEWRIPLTVDQLKKQRQQLTNNFSIVKMCTDITTLKKHAFRSGVPVQAVNGIEHYNTENAFHYLWRLEG